MERKNFIKTVKLHKICEENYMHPVFAYIHFENGYAYATNGRVLVKAKLSDICYLDDEEMLAKLNGKSLHLKQFQSLLNLDEITEITDEAITAAAEGYKVSFKFKDIKYPNAEKVFEDFYKSGKNPVGKIMFYPKLLKLLGEVMPTLSKGVIFEFGEHNNSAVLVRYPTDGISKDIKVVIMPMCCNK